MNAARGDSVRAMKRLVLGALNAYDLREVVPESVPASLWGLQADEAGRLQWDGCALEDLARQFGTPLHVVSRRQLEATYRRFHGAFASRYPNVKVAYSYKTNPLPGVLSALHECGADAEVISHYELWLALRLGVPPERIVFNGPAKTPEAVALAVERGVKLINVDGDAEIAMIEACAARLGRRQAVGLRVVASVGWSGQFGFRIADGGALAAFRQLRACRHLDPCGLHLHLGTDVRNAHVYFEASREVFAFAGQLANDLRVDIRHFDLGGGFGVPTVRPLSSMELRYLEQGLPVRAPRLTDVPTIEEYAAGIVPIVERYVAARGIVPPELIFEPGRALTSSAQCLLLGVLSTKPGVNGTRFAIADGGRNLTVPLGYEYHQLFVAGSPQGGATARYTVCGPLCHPSDIVAAQRDLPGLQAGDVLAVMDAGAYFIPNQTNFSNPRPAAVIVEAGDARLIRRREEFPDLLRLDVPAAT
jgi:diaminopimelate decarboxylase